MAAKKFSFYHIPVMSFFSKELYRDVGLNWKGVGFAYLLLLLAVCWIPAMIKTQRGFSNFVDNDAPRVVEQVPEITIKDGQVSINKAEPYYIMDPDSDDVLAVIDTTGAINSLEDANALCLLTQTQLIYRKSHVETRSFDLSRVEDFVLDSERITGWLNSLRKVLVIVMYPLAVLGSYGYRIIQALIYGVIGLLFAKAGKVTLSYSASLRLAVVAVTPCIVISTVLGLAGTSLPGFLYLVVALGYLFFGVKSCGQEPDAPEEAQVVDKDDFGLRV